ncbi:hypothetical protein CAPTEDRAFT_193197 [Capitella teleta]|uniref:Uncharacterized protein n=1 Tax=Capitella teleta TaxID=283909 RepID=R7UMR0_CAPTE|nr:hypothetical protein CAPTEDRAFT_193197 [Capitella teleta]|eukprot:ELU07824.1 hypothetical protein CAPTEDRAFT_193197 [Capitella teleta]
MLDRPHPFLPLPAAAFIITDHPNDDVMGEVQDLYLDRRGSPRDLDDVIDELEGQMNEMGRTDRPTKQQIAARNTMVKRKIIQRKYFKEPQEMNLLTWDAKEQIRYLHAEFPDEWGVDQLAESFPVSPEGVVRLLKSKWVPRNLQDLIKHDKRVQDNWKALKSGYGTTNIAKEDLAKYQLMAHASGIASLPQPEQDLLKFPSEERSPPGLFESMYLKTKGIEAPKQRESDPRAALRDHLEANSNLLEKLAFNQPDTPRGKQQVLMSAENDPHRRAALLDADDSAWSEPFTNADLTSDVSEDPGMAGTGRIE